MTRNVTSATLGPIDRAVSALTAAWDPPLATDEDWDGDGCACGGEDSIGRPYCNCGDGCCCEQCTHFAHVRSRFCAVKDCSVEARRKVKAWVLAHHRVQAKEIHPELTAETGGDEWADLDEFPLYTWSKSACSNQHARQIIDHDRSWRETPGEEPGMRYEVTDHRYEPDDLDLPAMLAELREAGQAARRHTAYLARAGYAATAADTFDPAISLEYARRVAARLVRTLAALETRQPPTTSALPARSQLVLPGQHGDDDD